MSFTLDLIYFVTGENSNITFKIDFFKISIGGFYKKQKKECIITTDAAKDNAINISGEKINGSGFLDLRNANLPVCEKKQRM